jgi:hypothetical protein
MPLDEGEAYARELMQAGAGYVRYISALRNFVMLNAGRLACRARRGRPEQCRATALALEVK